jgi:hypothetical protein
MSEKDKFWGSITANGKVYAIVGGPDAPERAKRALGTMSPIVAAAPSAPLVLAPLAPEATPAEVAPPVAAEAAARKENDAVAPPEEDKQHIDVDRSVERARSGRFDGSKPSGASKWAMVRAPKPPPEAKKSFVESADAAKR